jgi:hypothetical protein
MATPPADLLDELCVRFILTLPAEELECVHERSRTAIF